MPPSHVRLRLWHSSRRHGARPPSSLPRSSSVLSLVSSRLYLSPPFLTLSPQIAMVTGMPPELRLAMRKVCTSCSSRRLPRHCRYLWHRRSHLWCQRLYFGHQCLKLQEQHRSFCQHGLHTLAHSQHSRTLVHGSLNPTLPQNILNLNPNPSTPNLPQTLSLSLTLRFCPALCAPPSLQTARAPPQDA